jgi:hypothetical protein
VNSQLQPPERHLRSRLKTSVMVACALAIVCTGCEDAGRPSAPPTQSRSHLTAGHGGRVDGSPPAGRGNQYNANNELRFAAGVHTCQELKTWYRFNPGDSNREIAAMYSDACGETPPPVLSGEISLTPEPVGPPTDGVTLVKDARYDDAGELRLAAAASGLACPQWQRPVRPGFTAGTEADCSPTTLIYAGLSPLYLRLEIADFREGRSMLKEANVAANPYILVGPNWIISVAQTSKLRQLQRHMGGELVKVG